MMQETQTSPRMTVMRLRLRSATPEAPEVGGDAAAEHVGQTATATAVQQDEQRQQQAGDAEQHLHDDLENFHEEPFETAPRTEERRGQRSV